MPASAFHGFPWWPRLRGGRSAGRDAGAQVRVIPWGAGVAPRTVVVKADRPIRLVFERRDGGAWDSVAIPALGWVSTLGSSARVPVELGPCRAGAYTFTSVDGAHSGCLVVEP